jgi:hypothetical protein
MRGGWGCGVGAAAAKRAPPLESIRRRPSPGEDRSQLDGSPSPQSAAESIPVHGARGQLSPGRPIGVAGVCECDGRSARAYVSGCVWGGWPKLRCWQERVFGDGLHEAAPRSWLVGPLHMHWLIREPAGVGAQAWGKVGRGWVARGTCPAFASMSAPPARSASIALRLPCDATQWRTVEPSCGGKATGGDGLEQ